MKKVIISGLFFILCINLIGCGMKSGNSEEGSQNDQISQKSPGIEGYVVQKENGEVLVVSSEAKDFSSTGGLSEFYNAIWVSGVSNEIQIGQKVRVWFNGPILESFPGQGEASKVTIIPGKNPKGAQLSEAQVIKKALTKKGSESKEITVIKDVKYNENTKTWYVLLKTGDEKEVEIEIID